MNRLRASLVGSRVGRASKRLLAGASVLALVAGCSQGDGGDPSATGPEARTQHAGDTGSLSLELTAPGGVTLNDFAYAITGPNFAKAGHIDVSKSTTVSAVVDLIPAGSGYSLTLSGTAQAPTPASCSGSASFAITAGATTSVPVTIACHVKDQQVPPAPVPVPPFAPIAVGCLLLALGARASRRLEPQG